MKKLLFIFNILKRRVFNIVLLSIMFSSLLLIFMVGFSLKDIFYEYLRSDYGNIADIQVKVNDLSSSDLLKMRAEVKAMNQHIDILYGYEGIYDITVTDSEDSILAKEMPVLLRGLNLDKRLEVQLDSKKMFLEINSFEYDDALHIEMNLDGYEPKDKDSIKFIARGESVELNFCTTTYVEEDKLILESRFCKDKIDTFFKKIENNSLEFLDIFIDEKKQKLKIVDFDLAYRTLVLEYANCEISEEDSKNIEVSGITVDEYEAYDGELILTFGREENVELEYKRYIAQILENYINYNRFVLNVKYYAFSDDDEVGDESVVSDDKELSWLNELTDFLDMIVKHESNFAVSSVYLANDLNNLGLLDNFTISSADVEFVSSIRSTFVYNPERLYDKNILIFNKKVLQRYYGVSDENNFIDIYVSYKNRTAYEQELKELILKYDSGAKFIMQDDIIPSITPKKYLFNIVIIIFSLLIFGILFVSMYVVLMQFYSNFASELALLKLFGLNHPYQSYINMISFFISSILIYFLLKEEESQINTIIIEYFFTKYDFDMFNYVISITILSLYIVVIYLFELLSIKKLNLIKGQ